MGIFSKADKPESVLPALNIGAMLDIPTGTPMVGMKGETITCGGYQMFNGVVGEGNVGKSQLALYMYVTVLARYGKAEGLIGDTEGNLKKYRQTLIAKALYPDLLYTEEEINVSGGDIDFGDIRRSTYTSIEKYYGDEMWNFVKEAIRENGKQIIETPFMGRGGKPVSMHSPILFLLDSISMFQVSAQVDIKDEENIGGKKRNMEAMRDAGAKSQLMLEIPAFSTRNGLYTIMTAHVGQQHQLDPMQPPKKILAYLSQKQKIKNVPEKFLFTPQNVFLVFGTNTMFNSSSDKSMMYPRTPDDKENTINELQYTNVLSLRNKDGISGSPITILMSQTEGILPSLSEYHHCKTNDRFGMIGNNVTSAMAFLPDEKFTRVNIRTKLRENELLRNAVRLTSEILQIKQYWPLFPSERIVSPEVLYENLKNMGYDWNELLQTRGYWTPDQYDNPVRFLSGADLLNMNAGLYKPYWM